MNLFTLYRKCGSYSLKSGINFCYILGHNNLVINCIILCFIVLVCCKKNDVPADEAMPKKWEALLPKEIYYCSPAIDSKGVLYISDLSGRVYALQTESTGLEPLAAWPKFRHDNQNTGHSQ